MTRSLLRVKKLEFKERWRLLLGDVAAMYPAVALAVQATR